MSDRSAIEWTEASWNPITGCTKVSPGCDHCYAETFAERWRGIPGHHFEHGFDVVLRPDKLTLPLKWRKPRRVFVNSMSDLFHDAALDEYIARVFATMALAPQHTFQVLTKRHARMRSLLNSSAFRIAVLDAAYLMVSGEIGGVEVPRMTAQAYYGRHDATLRGEVDSALPGWPLPNIWLGVSVENQQWADIRIPALLDTPAAVRWISAEPLLGPVNLRDCDGLDVIDYLDWVVAGGESGPGARPMEPAWARSLRDQCVEAGVPFFFKQWGEWAPNGWRHIGATERISKGRERQVGPPLDHWGHREAIERMGKKRAGRELDGRTWDEYPLVAVTA